MASEEWRALDCVEWIYERPEGDIVVYARTLQEAVETIMHHGFTNVDAKKVRRGQSELTDILKQDEIG